MIILKRKKIIKPLTSRGRDYFQQFYEENKGLLFYIVCKYAKDPTEREDLMQDSLVRLLKNEEVLRRLCKEQCTKYMELTVKSAWLDMERRRCREKLILLDEGALEALIGSIRVDAEESDAVTQLCCGLSARDWAVLEGKYILGYSEEQLGEQFGISTDSMRALLSRARKRARKILSEKDGKGDV